MLALNRYADCFRGKLSPQGGCDWERLSPRIYIDVVNGRRYSNNHGDLRSGHLEQTMQLILRLHRLSFQLQQARMGILSRSIDGILRVFFAASLPGRARIGKGVFFHHSGLGVVINALSVIEDDCEIGVHVVLGGRTPEIGAPHLGRGVIVHAGARIIGPVRIGAGAVVGANAVVLDDVPSGGLAVGIPAVIKRLDVNRRDYAHKASPR